MAAPSRITFHCPRPECRARVDLVVAESPYAATCPVCQNAIRIELPPQRSAAPLNICPVCGGREFFNRRDFPQRLGLAIVVAAGLLSFYFFQRSEMFAAWGVLAGAVVIDALLALCTGRLTVCYRCRAELRGGAYNPAWAGFDLATAEKYKQG